MRRFLTKGALSNECANLPHECSVCSSRMSPIPTPHTPGNMWLARCDYIAQLVDPFVAKEGQLSSWFEPHANVSIDACKGLGRFFAEHWVHSHPSVVPCDLYSGREYTWAYINMPSLDDFVPDLQLAPRFGINVFNHLYPKWCQDFKKNIRTRYKILYNISRPEKNWWGWETFDDSHVDPLSLGTGKTPRRN